MRTVVDVLLRWLFNSPISGFNEIISMGLAIAISATFPAGAAQRVNLTVDFLSRRISQRSLARLKVLGAVALAAVLRAAVAGASASMPPN